MAGDELTDSVIEDAEALLSRWQEAFNTRDPARVVELYADDAKLLGTSQARLYLGLDEVRTYFRGTSTVSLGARVMDQLSEDTVLCVGHYQFSREQDGQVVKTPARFTFVLTCRDGAWRILHHHSSAARNRDGLAAAQSCGRRNTVLPPWGLWAWPRATTCCFLKWNKVDGTTSQYGHRGLLLASLCGLAGCTGSAETLALRPDFGVHTPYGVAAVSVREAPPGMADDRFVRMIEEGMGRAEPGSVVVAAAQAPYSARRIVWHVEPEATRGVSRVTVNSFNGRDPFAVEQEVMTDDATEGEIVATVETMTRRLAADDRRDAWAMRGMAQRTSLRRPRPRRRQLRPNSARQVPRGTPYGWGCGLSPAWACSP